MDLEEGETAEEVEEEEETRRRRMRIEGERRTLVVVRRGLN